MEEGKSGEGNERGDSGEFLLSRVHVKSLAMELVASRIKDQGGSRNWIP